MNECMHVCTYVCMHVYMCMCPYECIIYNDNCKDRSEIAHVCVCVCECACVCACVGVGAWLSVCRYACARALTCLLECLSVHARMGIAWVVLMHVYL